MGEVYRARDTQLGRDVAVKVLPSTYSVDEHRLSRFEQEASAASALNHPNILIVHDIGSHDGSPYVVSELLEGETLRKRISGAALAQRRAIGYALEIANGLAAAHEKGIVHRDLKPDNIFITKDGRVKILDFGIAKLTQADATRSQTDIPTRRVDTGPGIVMGTVGYMSPEQVRGQKVDHRSDIFSFGAILYEMLSGRRAFHGESAADTMSAILKEDPPDLSDTNQNISAALERLVNHCLEKNPESRFHSASDLAFALETANAKLTVSSPGLSTASPSSSAEYIVTGIKRHKISVLLGLLVLAIAIAGLASYLHVRNTEIAIESIAVLPFANQNHDPDTEYLSDGLTESIINSLSQLSNLRVIPRSSVFRYKGKESDPLTVGKELGVRAVLTGRILQRGDNLIVSAELVDVRDNKQLWGEQYNRKTADALTVQQEIAQVISARLRPKLSGEEQRQVAKRETTSPEAYQLYLKGRYYLEKRTKEGTSKAIEYFQQAIDKDPNYAAAFAGLADSYVLLSVAIPRSSFPPKEAFPKAKAAAMQALQIDDKLAEAHTSLAHIKFVYEWDWASAEREFKRAIELDPNYATAHHWYGFDLAAVGRFDEAIIEIRKAQEIDPLSPIINASAGWVFYYARQYDQAIEQERKALEIDPNFALAHGRLAQAYEQKGMYKDAIEEYLRALTLSGENQEEIAALRQAYTVSGMRGFWQKQLDLAIERSKRQHVSASVIAGYYAHLGEREQAIQWLEKAYEERDALSWLKGDPRWDGLRSDPRFADLMRRVGL